jgi:organic radical activating enzyme
MKTYQVSEIFRSVQGEGPEVGMDALFIRLAGCNLRCPFCDEGTRAHVGEPISANVLVAQALDLLRGDRPERVILTGGEPLLQADRALMDALRYSIAPVSIETNGSDELDNNPELLAVLMLAERVVVSPKTKRLSRVLLDRGPLVDLKVLVPFPGDIDTGWLVALAQLPAIRDLYLQPVTPKGWNDEALGAHVFRANAAAARDMQMALATGAHHRKWRVLPQTHVWMEMR